MHTHIHIDTRTHIQVRPSGEDDGSVEMTNLTLINIAIRVLGPTQEGALTNRLLVLQVMHAHTKGERRRGRGERE
jgi:hypothetical protein